MGSVALLTREGEIEIAKRIEEGLIYMIQAISACPTTIAEILELATHVKKDQLRIEELVDGLIDLEEDADGFSAINLTFLNYCNIDYEYPGDPSKNLKKRSTTIMRSVHTVCGQA